MSYVNWHQADWQTAMSMDIFAFSTLLSKLESKLTGHHLRLTPSSHGWPEPKSSFWIYWPIRPVKGLIGMLFQKNEMDKCYCFKKIYHLSRWAVSQVFSWQTYQMHVSPICHDCDYGDTEAQTMLQEVDIEHTAIISSSFMLPRWPATPSSPSPHRVGSIPKI